MATRVYEAKKFEKELVHQKNDALTIEEALQVSINGEPFTVAMRTPGDDIDLVRGLLHVEGMITDSGYTPKYIESETNETGVVRCIDVVIPADLLGDAHTNSRSLLSVSSCGICGKTKLEDLEVSGPRIAGAPALEVHKLQELFEKMNKQQFDFKQSGGTHAAAAFDMGGNLLCAMEDIGRHNAVDKVVGRLLGTKMLEDAKILTVSGRISYEIVIKCFKARIPYLAAVSAPSSLAVDFAKELGITLFAFCRGDRVTCYANPHRAEFKMPQP